MTPPDLFTYTPPDPPSPPRRRGSDTSRAAAEHIAPRLPWLRAKCMEVLRAAQAGLTADQVAERIGESILAVRPRITELLHDEKIEDTGERRRNNSGRSAKVWRAR